MAAEPGGPSRAERSARRSRLPQARHLPSLPRFEVPTGLAHVCTTVAEVEEALDALGAPHVVKDDGLAAGKGVVVTDDRAEALEHARACLAKPEGAVVIEEYLDGPEVSMF